MERAGSVAVNVAAIRARIARAAERAGRDPASVCLVGASKSQPFPLIEAAIAAGVTDIGENYVQEAIGKRARVQGAARWHLIGHLQRNKAARAVDTFDVIQTLDTAALASVLDRLGAERNRVIPVLIEVNVGGEASKRGVAPAGLADLLGALRPLRHLRIDGLMSVPPAGTAEATRPFFRSLRELRDRHGLVELSMGMSDDFEVAIEEGATMVRIGRAIFGERTSGAGVSHRSGPETP